MHTESMDNVSVEEALEAKEDSNSASSTTTSSAGTPTDTSDNSFNFPISGPSSLPNSPRHDTLDNNGQYNGPNPSDDQEIDPILIAPVWVADELVRNCNACGQSFNLIRRRHHCRNCGHIYCNPCSSHFVPLTQFGYNRPVRVCDFCYRSYPIHENVTTLVPPSASSVNNADQWSS